MKERRNRLHLKSAGFKRPESGYNMLDTSKFTSNIHDGPNNTLYQNIKNSNPNISNTKISRSTYIRPQSNTINLNKFE